ncbi:MAG: discoidin domain-containing protein, partial [Bacteroidales bacterium]|nr:discoidin domain-containing protein [Bacteroidales bacterium]
MKTTTKRIWITMCIAIFFITGNMMADNLAAADSASATASTGNAALAIDADMGSRWESVAENDGQWIVINLNAVFNLSEINIVWEGANAEAYTLDVTEYSSTWTRIDSFYNKESAARTDVIILDINAQFVRVNCYNRNLNYGYSIFDFQVEGVPVGHVGVLDSILLEKNKTRVAVNEEVTFEASGLDEDGFTMATTPVWSADGGTITDGVFSSATKGIFNITATDGSISNSIEIKVGDPQIMGSVAYATSGNSPVFAVDNNMGTRWNSDATDTAAIFVDLQNVYALSEIMIHWEAANAEVYGLDYSNDSINWINIDSVTDGVFGNRTDAFTLTQSARFVRMNASKRTSAYANSIFEFQVFGLVDTPTAVESLEKRTDLKLYPNPIEDQLFIESEIAVEHISIYRLNGQLVKAITPNGTAVNVSDLTKGYYLTRVKFVDGSTAVNP